MSVRRNGRRVLHFLLLVSLLPVSPTPAHAASPWRFWTKADGLKETAVFGLTADRTGRVLVKSGDTPADILDGYQSTDLPGPHVYGRLLVSPEDKEVWSFDAEGIDVYDASGWHRYPDSDIAAFTKNSPIFRTSAVEYAYYRGAEDRIDVAPLGKDSAVIMFPDRLVEWNRATGRKRSIRLAVRTGLSRFRDLQPSRDGGIWISGAKGLARLKSAGDDFEWTEFPAPRRFTDLVNPIEGDGREVFVSALRGDGKRALVRFADGAWQEVFVSSAGQLKGWRGMGGAVWLQEGRKIVELGGMPLHDLGGGREITGLPTAVVSRPGGAFWLGTTEGAALYSPPLWRTPAELSWADTLVSAIAEDRQGRVWFLNGRYLAVNDGGKWSRFPLPSGRSAALVKDRIVILGNGDLAMRANSLADLVVFHPVSGKSGSGQFRVVHHPDGKEIGWMAARNAGGAWVQVFENGGAAWNLEVFDGERFLPGGQPQIAAQENIRSILEARNGDIWLGSVSSLGRFRGGKFQSMGEKEGFVDTGVFSTMEMPDGKILIGGRENLTEYDGKSFLVLQKADLIESMALGTDGVVWTASGSGIHRYRQGNWITNTVEDGLPATAVRVVYSDRRGAVWAGTSRGIGLFHPEADPDPPSTRIIDDRNLRETPPGGEVRLAFSGTDKWKYTSPERLTFSWRMDGSPWSDFGPSQFVSFRSLHSGAHRFEARAMDRNGNIETSPARYLFSVLQPWYLEKQFLTLASLAALLILWLSRMAWLHHRKLAFQSRHDPLTGLANRAVFEMNFQEALAEARAAKKAVAMILLDLDRFKPVNDTLGHGVGDAFLREVSARLQSTVRRQDTLARLGGDEFAILMPGLASRVEAERMAQRVLHALRQPYCIESYEVNGSASIGLSLFPEHGDDAATLHRLADMAMYQCKARNKDEYAVFDPDANRIDFRSAHMAGLIREALEHGYFEVCYQPLTNMDGELVRLEALVRMQHPRFGSISPNDFVPIAEGTGLIVRVGNWVMREACRQMAEWHAAGHGRLRVCVNVSAIQLMKTNFAGSVKSVLTDTGLDPRSLSLEITETALMPHLHESRRQIEQLRSLGITVALDDFGTGYSTLSSLHLLPVDCLKIDRSFIERIGEGSHGLAVVRKIVELGHEFGFEVVAEGVETREQAAGLKSIGCDMLQGFLLGEPAPAGATRELLETASFRRGLERMRESVEGVGRSGGTATEALPSPVAAEEVS